VTLNKPWAERHKSLVLSVIIILAVAGVFATLTQGSRSAQSNFKLQEALDRIAVTTAESSRVNALNTKLQEKLLEQSDRILVVGKSAIDTATGGDSFCYVVFGGDGSPGALVHGGQYPLSDVRMRIVDLDKFARAVNDSRGNGRPFTLADIQQAEQLVLMGNVPAKSSAILPQTIFTPALSEGQVLKFNLFFSAKNGFWEESVMIRRIDGKRRQALRVVRTIGKQNKVLHESIDPLYPRNQHGNACPVGYRR
jgi:hypothetical protein